jgi:diadenosine tetraphosphate (Ap4A) HIT family hydrolase
MNQCQICNKHKIKENIIYETQSWIITHGPLESQILGYLYLAPKRHIENWCEFTEEELTELGPLIKKIEKVLKEELNLERLYAVTISEVLRHIHVHLIPREEENEVKGLPLIEQATQQKNDIKSNYFNEKDWLKKLKIRLLSS